MDAAQLSENESVREKRGQQRTQGSGSIVIAGAYKTRHTSVQHSHEETGVRWLITAFVYIGLLALVGCGEDPISTSSGCTAQDNGDGTWSFDLTMGVPTNKEMQNLTVGDEWFRQKPWNKFNPSAVGSDQLESIHLTLTRQPRSLDAWPEYERLFKDGKVTMTHQGICLRIDPPFENRPPLRNRGLS